MKIATMQIFLSSSTGRSRYVSKDQIDCPAHWHVQRSLVGEKGEGGGGNSVIIGSDWLEVQGRPLLKKYLLCGSVVIHDRKQAFRRHIR